MKKMILRLYNNNVVRYVFFGGLTTLVNLLSFFLLRNLTSLNREISNIISITMAIIFAFITNSKYVFESEASGMAAHLREFIKFFGGRLTTMAIEVCGVDMFVWLHMKEMTAKLITQFLVLTLNFVISRFLVFRGQNTF